MPVVTTLVMLLTTSPAHALDIALQQVSSDPFTNTSQIDYFAVLGGVAQHKTQVEPDTFSFGSTVVSAFQSGRFQSGGSEGIGFATTTDGQRWTSGHLPNLTLGHGGPYARVTDPSVAYDRKHNVWIISSLGFVSSGNSLESIAILSSRSFDGGRTWAPPVVAVADPGADKNWITCDNTPTSPFYGSCYIQYHGLQDGSRIRMARSSNGGLQWSVPVVPAGNPTGWGGQPVVLPNGRVVVPYSRPTNPGEVRAFISTNGGAGWGGDNQVAQVENDRGDLDLRGLDQNFVSAEVDAAERVYVAWSDCRFRANCEHGNDIVMATSTNGTGWTAPVRVTFTSGDHFIPAVAVDRTAVGRLGVVYLRHNNPDCAGVACSIGFGYVSSINGGASWSAHAAISNQMPLTNMPDTTRGRMLGDYFSGSIINGHVATVIPIVRPKFGTAFNQAMHVPYSITPVRTPLPITGGSLH